jgi:hypothetical protein
MLTSLAVIPAFLARVIVVRAGIVTIVARIVVVRAGIVTIVARMARIVAGMARIVARWWVVGSWVAAMVWIATRNDQPVPGIDAVWIEDAIGVSDGMDCGAIPPGDPPQVLAPAHDVNDPCTTGGTGRWGCPHSLPKEHKQQGADHQDGQAFLHL